MEPNLYKAAAEGNIEPFKEIANDDLRSLVTPTKSSVMHVYIASQTQNRKGERVSTVFVEWILERCPSLLIQINAKGDAPLHVAAKRGHLAVVEVLIEFAKNQQPNKELESGVETVRHMLGMTNEEQNTALHEAVQYNMLEVVEILMKTDLDFPYSANGIGQTPLYMAVARGSVEIVTVLLENCPSAAHEGPNGENALHAAVRNKNAIGAIEQLLEKKKRLSRERDQHGWTPLHHAAYLGYVDAISMLLLKSGGDANIAYIVDKDWKMTALHLAASQGNNRTVKEIIRLCPECCDMVDDRGWNVLHFAMVSMEYKEYLKDLLEECPILMNLINDKDVKGNTPLHVLAAVRRHSSYRVVVPSNGKGDYGVVNNENISVQHIIRYGYPELKKEIKELSKNTGSGHQYYNGVIFDRGHLLDDTNFEENEKVRASHLVVDALIATVSFAAAFTIPGVIIAVMAFQS